jgi:site-specific recombinase XerD
MAITYKLELNSKPKEDNTCGILLRITENRKHKRISTCVFVPAKDFNKKAEAGKWIRRSNPEYASLNETLSKKIKQAKEAENKLSNNNQVATAKNIISEVKHKESGSFIKYYESALNNVEKTASYNFHKNALSKLNNLKGFLQGKDLLISEIDSDFLTNYEIHLEKKGNSDNTINSNIKLLRIFYYKAIKDKKKTNKNLMINNPFEDYPTRKVKTTKKSLNVEQLKQLETLELENYSTLWHVRNFFLICFYGAGVRVGDGIQLRWSDIENNCLVYKMDKNKERQFLELHQKALNILLFYKSKDSKPEDYIFPFLDNTIDYSDKKFLGKQISSKTAMMNYNLKKLSKLANIETKICTHISRHTSANNMRKSGASLYDISKLLRHSSIKVTEEYLDNFDNETTNKAHLGALDF